MRTFYTIMMAAYSEVWKWVLCQEWGHFTRHQHFLKWVLLFMSKWGHFTWWSTAGPEICYSGCCYVKMGTFYKTTASFKEWIVCCVKLRTFTGMFSGVKLKSVLRCQDEDILHDSIAWGVSVCYEKWGPLSPESCIDMCCVELRTLLCVCVCVWGLLCVHQRCVCVFFCLFLFIFVDWLVVFDLQEEEKKSCMEKHASL